MRECKTRLYYPGSVISVNHYTGRTRSGGVYVKKEAVEWQDALGWQLKGCHIEDRKLPIKVRCDGFFDPKDERARPDLSNLSKCTLDAIEDLTGINDRFLRWEDGDYKLCEPDEQPYLLITVKEE